MAINKSTTFATDTGNLGWKSSACTGAVGSVGWCEDVDVLLSIIRMAGEKGF